MEGNDSENCMTVIYYFHWKTIVLMNILIINDHNDINNKGNHYGYHKINSIILLSLFLSIIIIIKYNNYPFRHCYLIKMFVISAYLPIPILPFSPFPLPPLIPPPFSPSFPPPPIPPPHPPCCTCVLDCMALSRGCMTVIRGLSVAKVGLRNPALSRWDCTDMSLRIAMWLRWDSSVAKLKLQIAVFSRWRLPKSVLSTWEGTRMMRLRIPVLPRWDCKPQCCHHEFAFSSDAKVRLQTPLLPDAMDLSGPVAHGPGTLR